MSNLPRRYKWIFLYIIKNKETEYLLLYYMGFAVSLSFELFSTFWLRLIKIKPYSLVESTVAPCIYYLR